MKLEHGTDCEFDFPLIGHGKSGYGFYCYFPRSSGMRNYYDKGYILSIEIQDEDIIDLTTRTNYKHCSDWIKKQTGSDKITKNCFQQSGFMLTAYVQHFYPEKKGFVNFHFGDKIPDSKEIVIFDLSNVQSLNWIKKPKIDNNLNIKKEGFKPSF